MILRERDVPGGANIGLIDAVARYALEAGYHVVDGGIPCTRTGTGRCCGTAGGPPGAEPLLLPRRAAKPQAAEYGEQDLLAGGIERVIGAESSLDGTIGQVMGVFAA
jgi:hypothetical protein